MSGRTPHCSQSTTTPRKRAVTKVPDFTEEGPRPGSGPAPASRGSGSIACCTSLGAQMDLAAIAAAGLADRLGPTSVSGSSEPGGWRGACTQAACSLEAVGLEFLSGPQRGGQELRRPVPDESIGEERAVFTDGGLFDLRCRNVPDRRAKSPTRFGRQDLRRPVGTFGTDPVQVFMVVWEHGGADNPPPRTTRHRSHLAVPSG